VDALLADARSQLAGSHLEASRQYQQQGFAGCAVLHAAAALGYLPDDFEAGRQLGQCAEQVRREVGYTIAFVGFRANPEHGSLAALFGAAALEHLARTRPANVTVVDRIDLQTILDEQDLNLSGLIDPAHSVAGGKLRGVDALIVGQVLEGRVVVENKRAGHGESTYQDGYRPAPNPDYVQAAKELDAAITALEHARQRLAEAEARLARYRHIDPANPEEVARRHKAEADVDEASQRLINAAADVGAARIRVGSIPPEVLVPNMVKYQYPIQTFTKTARVSCMVKVLDTATGELIAAERIEGQHAESDRVIAGEPHRNVPEDPLELSDDDAMLERASDPAITRLRQVLTQACAKHGLRFAIRMHQAEAAGDVEQAVDAGVKYLFAYPTGHEQTNAMVDFLRKYLGDEAGLIDIRQLLRTHCHVLQ
jgi:curli biogenesis system outer membrane secretion channel CsgG